jgi:predicted RecB family endonuclease
VVSVVKASGAVEAFDAGKLASSIARCGVPGSEAWLLAREVERGLPEEVSSGEVYARALELLRERYPACALRYALRRGIMMLGPEGYPFEKYVAKLLARIGYAVRTNVVARGRCISHELDVVAEREGERVMVECKYHNAPGVKVDAKVALYVHARFLDLSDQFDKAWIVTNTKVTEEAAAYAECVGMRVTAWRYPEGAGLEKLVEDLRLYPVTVLPSLGESARRSLLKRGIVTLDDLLRAGPAELAASGLRPEEAEAAVREAELLQQLG